MNQLTNIQQTMSSREIADMTNKQHKDVLKAIRSMEASWEKVAGRKFALSEYEDSTGRKLPMYKLTKKESLYIATKFNDEARAKLIIRWEELEMTTVQKPLTGLDFLQHQLDLMRLQDQRVSEVENKVALLEAKTSTRPDYFTIAGYWSLNGVKITVQQAAAIGKKAVSICNKEGFPMDVMPDPRFGKVRLYPTDVLKRVFNETTK